MGNRNIIDFFDKTRFDYKPIQRASCFQKEEELSLNEKFYGTKKAPAIIHIIYKDGTERYYRAKGKHFL